MKQLRGCMNSDDLYWYNDALVCDIDDTLIYGKFVAFMDLTWKIFKSPMLAKILSKIQAKFKFYKVHHKIAELVVQFIINGKRVYFLTARGFDISTVNMINDIIPTRGWMKIVQLGSKDPSRDKFEWIQGNLDSKEKILLIDDNLRTRLKCIELHNVEAYHPEDLKYG